MLTLRCLADLHILGGLEPVVAELNAPGGFAAASAHVLGVAASNNERFQRQLLHAVPDIFSRLLQVRTGAPRAPLTPSAKGLLPPDPEHLLPVASCKALQKRADPVF